MRWIQHSWRQSLAATFLAGMLAPFSASAQDAGSGEVDPTVADRNEEEGSRPRRRDEDRRESDVVRAGSPEGEADRAREAVQERMERMHRLQLQFRDESVRERHEKQLSQLRKAMKDLADRGGEEAERAREQVARELSKLQRQRMRLEDRQPREPTLPREAGRQPDPRGIRDHLRAAIENLHAAGLHDHAERVVAELHEHEQRVARRDETEAAERRERGERQRRERQETRQETRQPRARRAAEGQPRARSDAAPRPRAARRPEAAFPEPPAEVRDLRRELDSVRTEMAEMRRILEKLLENSR